MLSMEYVKPELQKVNKHASDFLNFLHDERRNLGLEKFAGRDMIRIDSNHGSGGKIYIDKELRPVFDEFLKTCLIDK